MNNYFCVLPYYSFELGMGHQKNIFCCKLAPRSDIEQVRNSIRNKSRSPHCTACWDLEDHGLQSERQVHNSTFDYLLDRDIESIENDAVQGHYNTKIIKLHTSNICNGTCVTCGSGSSSAWASLESKKISYQIAPDSMLDTINWAEAVQLSFVGGEPLLEKKNFGILEHLIALGNTKCFISIVTNGSVELSTKQLAVLSAFPNINICLSIDGVGQSFEYLRYPLSWDLFNTNLKRFKEFSDNISVSCMISNLNVYYYTDMVDYFKSEGLNYICRPIVFPDYFSPGNLPESAKVKIIQHNKKYQKDVEHFVSVTTPTPESLHAFTHEITRQDGLKEIKIEQYLPELTACLQVP
jgi:sulfatase maturation enzyme AslB (radical SAM superfamily)